eukprot:gene3069-3898_t
MWGWIDDNYTAPCIMDNPRTRYIEKLGYTSKDFCKLKSVRRIRIGALTPLLTFIMREGMDAVNRKKNYGFEVGIGTPGLVLKIDVEKPEDGIKNIDIIGVVTDLPTLNNKHRTAIGHESGLFIETESVGNLARFIYTCESREKANCALVIETKYHFYNGMFRRL